jgi:quercetin dioxygenase-like cupin family protein
MDVRRFGVGHRRPEGPAGSHGVEGLTLHADARGVLAELAFRPNSAIVPHSNPNLTYFVVIEGGGFVQVGEERTRVAAGEAIVWPPGVVHGAWTEDTPMRALVVEFPGAESEAEPRLLDANAGVVRPVEPVAEGSKIAAKATRTAGRAVKLTPDGPGRRASSEEEPW